MTKAMEDLEITPPQINASEHTNNVKFKIYRQDPTNEENPDP